MIDVLRASTTIITALAHGATRVRPVLSIDEARAAATAPTGGPRPLLGGERGGLRIDGFDLGNSPLEYTPSRVAGRPLVITTTNGTAALQACLPATEVVIGAIVNRAAVATRARDLGCQHGIQDVHLVCAGTDGEVTQEDLLAAGAILDAAAHLPGAGSDTLDAAAMAARDLFRNTVSTVSLTAAEAIAAFLTKTLGGSNLITLGMQADLSAAAMIDSFPLVPRLDRGSYAVAWLVADPPNLG